MGRHMKRTIKWFKLWDEILASYLYRNKSEWGEIKTDNFYADMRGFYSKEDNVTYIFSIDGYPSEIELSYRTTLRDVCRSGVRMTFINRFDKHQIMWGSPQIKAKLRTWQMIEQDGSEVNEYNLYENINTLDSQNWRKASLVYLATADRRRKRKMFEFRSILLVSGKRGEDFDKTIEDLIMLSKNIDIKLNRVMLNHLDFLSVFSPFSLDYDQKILDQVGSNVLTDEILARFSTYSHGKVGMGRFYWGTDIFSGSACLKDIKKNTEANETILITAEAGGGKSFFVKGLLFQLLSFPQYVGTVMDVEGFEYVPLACYVGNNDPVVILNMAEGQGVYYDPVEIVLTGNPKVDADMYSLSTSFTQSIFKTLLGATVEHDEWVDIVMSDAISLTYSKRGVAMENMSSWKYSKGLTLYDVYNTLKDLKTDGNVERAVNSSYAVSRYMVKSGLIEEGMSANDVNRLIVSNEGYQKAIEMCLAKVSRYFETSGIRASLFRKRVTADKIIDAKLVICSFGMSGKSEANTDKTQMALMQLCAANISYVRSVFSKVKGKYNFKVWEEAQRLGDFPDADKTIGTSITGGRKMGDINIVVTNDVGKLLNNDKFSIFPNLTSYAIGCIGDAKVREELCRRLTIPEFQPALDEIAVNNMDLNALTIGDLDTNNIYSKSFLIGLDKALHTVSRMSIPSELAHSDIFRTGIDINIEDVADVIDNTDLETGEEIEEEDFIPDFNISVDNVDASDFEEILFPDISEGSVGLDDSLNDDFLS